MTMKRHLIFEEIMQNHPRAYGMNVLSIGCPPSLFEELDQRRSGLWDSIYHTMVMAYDDKLDGLARPKRRSKTRLERRLNRCVICDYPISQFHHLVPVAEWGDNSCGITLCANCHEAYHIIENYSGRRDDRAAVFAKLLIEEYPWICWRIWYFIYMVLDATAAFREYETRVKE